MGYKLCMTEKPSVAREIANIIGATNHYEGYYEGNGYKVTWAIGHLVGLAEPEDYGYIPQKQIYAGQEKAAYEELPLIPSQFKLIVLEKTKKQFEIIKKLIHSEDVEEIINCGDMGPEGHILQWFIREKAGCKKSVKRFCATSLTEESIKKAMANLRDEEEFSNIIKGEYCKKKADWILGMSLSRVESIKYHTSINVGRVQSPTLYFIVKRYLDIQNFKVTDFFGIKLEIENGLTLSWNKDSEGIFPEDKKDQEGRVLDKNIMENKCNEIIKGKFGIITKLDIKNKKTDRPQLYDIIELQKDANKKYGYSASLTLSTAQSLYETHKILSYPRTDSRYLTTDIIPYLPKLMKLCATVSEKYALEIENLKTLNIDEKILNDAKVTDHHALILTENIKDFKKEKLVPTEKEKKEGVTSESLLNILHLVLSRMIVSLSNPYIYQQMNIEFLTSGIIFKSTIIKSLEQGWKSLQERLLGNEELEDEENNINEMKEFPEFNINQTIQIKDCFITEKKTNPPKLHTEATLLSAMKNAGSIIKDGAILKGKGIGTQATRAEIIKKLFDSGYCEVQKKEKTNFIMPTAKGLQIIRVLPKDLYSPQITADWEKKIALISDGKMTENEFMNDFIKFIKEKVKEVKNTQTNIEFKKESQTYGICPFCGSDIFRYQKRDDKKTSFYCSQKSCFFSIDTENPIVIAWTGKKITEKQCIEIINRGHILLDCKKKNSDGTYKVDFSITKKEIGDKIFTSLHCVPQKPFKKK